jgi:hypothetical protein
MTTSPPPHSAHLDPTTLADLDERLLDTEGTQLAWEHLATCPACQARRDALADLRDTLRQGGEITAMPDDVARRLDDALLEAAAGPATAAAAPTVTPLPSQRRTPWNTRILQAAAVVVLLLALGGLGFGVVQNALSGGSDTANSTASSAGKGADSGAPERAADSASGGYPATESGRDYTRESLRAAVPALVHGQVTASPVPKSESQGLQGATQLLRGRPLATCVANLADGPVTPLAVDAARYDGKPATIIVLPTDGDASTVDVYVVAPGCPNGTFIAWQRVTHP